MKGIIIVELDNRYNGKFPSVSKDVQQESEDLFMFAKRFQNTGEMNRRGPVGTVVKFQCKWGFLTSKQFADLQEVLVSKDFEVEFGWKGKKLKKLFYSGNISATPFLVRQDGLPKYYKDVSVNIISKRVIV